MAGGEPAVGQRANAAVAPPHQRHRLVRAQQGLLAGLLELLELLPILDPVLRISQEPGQQPFTTQESDVARPQHADEPVVK
jgi:hypothetical protein